MAISYQHTKYLSLGISLHIWMNDTYEYLHGNFKVDRIIYRQDLIKPETATIYAYLIIQ